VLTANQIKSLTALQLKKYRTEQGKFLVEGEKIVAELLQQAKFKVSSIYATGAWIDKQAKMPAAQLNLIQEVSETELKKISSLTTPNQVVAVVDLPQKKGDFAAIEVGLYYYLDGLQDPSNMGAILRIADWFGVKGVFCSQTTVDAYHPKVIQAGMGAFLRVPTHEFDLLTLKNANPTLNILGAVMNGEKLSTNPQLSNGILVIGNEGKGISKETELLLTHRLTIPRGASGGAESLNAAVATGILTFGLLEL
jgi:RNA methyltransferase, TrmH family